VAILLCGIIITALLARLLGPKGKGQYTIIFLITYLLGRFGSFGIEAANVYYTGKKKHSLQDIISNSIIVALFCGSFIILLFFLLSSLTFFQRFLILNELDALFLWIAVFTIPFSLLVNLLIKILLGEEKIATFNRINILQQVSQIIFILIFIFFMKFNLLGAIISYAAAVLLTLFVLISRLPAGSLRLNFNKILLQESLKYGIKCYLGNIAQFLSYRIDIFLIALYLSPVEVGLYSIAVGFAEKIWLLPQSIATVLFPRVSAITPKEADSLTPRITRYAFFIAFLSGLVFFLFAKFLIVFLFGADFLPSVRPLLILLPGIVLLGGAKTISSDLAGRGKPQLNTYIAFSSLLLNVCLNLWLIPRWGITGAAVATTLSYSLSAVVVILIFKKISQKSISEIIFVKKKDFTDAIRSLKET